MGKAPQEEEQEQEGRGPSLDHAAGKNLTKRPKTRRLGCSVVH